MKQLGEYLQKPLSEIFKSPRERFLEETFSLVNTQRETDGYKPLAMKVIAIKTSHLNEMDMDFFLKKMRASPTPSKVFFGSLKVKKDSL